MQNRLIRLFVFIGIIATLIVIPVSTQDAPCPLDLSEAEAHLAAAQSAASVDEAVEAMTQARLAIARQQHACLGDDESVGTARSNPVPFGEAKGVDDYFSGPVIIEVQDVSELTHEDVYRYSYLDTDDADEIEPYQWIAVLFEATCDKSVDESCDIDTQDWLLVGDKGLSYESQGYRFTEYEGTDEAEVFGGSSTLIHATFPTEPGDRNFILFPEFADIRVYYSAPIGQSDSVEEEIEKQSPTTTQSDTPTSQETTPTDEACTITHGDLTLEQQSFLNLRAERMWRLRDTIAEWDGEDIVGFIEDLEEWAFFADVAAYDKRTVKETLPTCAELSELDALFEQTLLNAYALRSGMPQYIYAVQSGNQDRIDRAVALIEYRQAQIVSDPITYGEIFESIGGSFRDPQ